MLNLFQNILNFILFRSLLLWGTQKKKPMSKINLAHGEDPESEVPNWIVSVATLQNTDLVATGNTLIFSSVNFLLSFFQNKC